MQSNTDRLVKRAAWLRRNGSALQIVHLQGALGFGTCRTVTRLIEQLVRPEDGDAAAGTRPGAEAEAGAGEAPCSAAGLGTHVLVCFRNVTSVDYSAGPFRAKPASRSLRRALLMPQVQTWVTLSLRQ